MTEEVHYLKMGKSLNNFVSYDIGQHILHEKKIGGETSILTYRKLPTLFSPTLCIKTNKEMGFDRRGSLSQNG